RLGAPHPPDGQGRGELKTLAFLKTRFDLSCVQQVRNRLPAGARTPGAESSGRSAISAPILQWSSHLCSFRRDTVTGIRTRGPRLTLWVGHLPARDVVSSPPQCRPTPFPLARRPSPPPRLRRPSSSGSAGIRGPRHPPCTPPPRGSP